MATAEGVQKPQEKTSRLKPFAWMKRLATKKSPSSERGRSSNKYNSPSAKSKASPANQNGQPSAPGRVQDILQSSTEDTAHDSSGSLANGSSGSLDVANDSNQLPAENHSIAPTLETNPGTIYSDTDHHSKAGTNTIGGAMSSTSGGGNSIFTSSNHSSHSLTTTLTTIQSAPSQNVLNQQTPQGGSSGTPAAGTSQPTSHHQAQPSQASSYFNHQYPTTPASAVPSHLNPHSHMPTTYRSATANNLLSDNASVITLASSSYHRVRRNSVDTDASIRAIAPSSTWGGSRESLPLSVLSQSTTNEPVPVSAPISTPATVSPVSTSHTPSASTQLTTSAAAAAQQQSGRPHSAVSGLSTERGSVYSSGGGVGAPVLSSERNSIYAGKGGASSSITGTDGTSLKGAHGAEGSSIRSGLAGHGRSESITGSIGGYTSPIAIPKEPILDGEKDES